MIKIPSFQEQVKSLRKQRKGVPIGYSTSAFGEFKDGVRFVSDIPKTTFIKLLHSLFYTGTAWVRDRTSETGNTEDLNFIAQYPDCLIVTTDSYQEREILCVYNRKGEIIWQKGGKLHPVIQ